MKTISAASLLNTSPNRRRSATKLARPIATPPVATPPAPVKAVKSATASKEVPQDLPGRTKRREDVTLKAATPRRQKMKDTLTSEAPNVEAAPVQPVEVPAARAVAVKKKRAPADLALQYGQNEARPARAAVVVEEARARPRRDAAAREQRKKLIAPDDALLQRLARAETVKSKPLVMQSEAPDVAARRSRVWQINCGKCGAPGKFSTPASLCSRCGAILVKG